MHEMVSSLPQAESVLPLVLSKSIGLPFCTWLLWVVEEIVTRDLRLLEGIEPLIPPNGLVKARRTFDKLAKAGAAS